MSRVLSDSVCLYIFPVSAKNGEVMDDSGLVGRCRPNFFLADVSPTAVVSLFRAEFMVYRVAFVRTYE